MAQKAMILLADDEAVNREALRSILSDEFEILEAADGTEAIRLLTEHEKEIEAVVLDLLMPRMDGWEFLEQYGKAAQWKDIPVIAASGDERSQTEHRCLEMGAWDFLRKPFDPTTVYFRLKNNISRRHVHLLEKQKLTDVFQR
ncbi:MAG: response regulator, partial [Oscillospiraceae bacterium]|nr:response regulator [Oscillospiraceae bacterium]